MQNKVLIIFFIICNLIIVQAHGNDQINFDVSEIEILEDGNKIIGKNTDDIKKIFKRFFREESSRSRDYGGLGLGLPIVKKILDLHNGDITIDSEIDKGTSVKIFLPIQT